MMEGSDGKDVAEASLSHAAAAEALQSLREAETRALHLVAAAARRVMTAPAAYLRSPSLGAALLAEIDEARLAVRKEILQQRVMLARLEALEAPRGPVLQLFCDMAQACRNRIDELDQHARDHHAAFAMVRSAGPMLGRREDLALLSNLTGAG